MAGGIDWFRWHHGSVTDPKFQLVARKAGQTLGNVIAVWAFVLEAASAATERGQFGDLDCEAVDCMLGMECGATEVILAAMDVRGLIVGGAVANWEKRQPKRERTDDSSTERVRAFREKQRQDKPCNATERQETPREEKSREEDKREEQEPKTKTARKRAPAAQVVSLDDLMAEGVLRQHAVDWLAARQRKNLPLTPTAWADTKAEAAKAGMTVPEAILVAAGNSWGGFKAAWCQQGGAGPPGRQTATDRRIETINALTGKRNERTEPTVIDITPRFVS